MTSTRNATDRPVRVVENSEFCGMMRRMMRAHRRRVANGSVEDLAQLVALRAELDETIGDAARALHQGDAVDGEAPNGPSWTEIAKVLGISRQAARQKFAQAGE